jgi:hypothetical protein
MKHLAPVTAIILGVALGLNALAQLIAPEPWFWAVPGVPIRGAYNPHFVRDIGLIYLACAGGLLLGAYDVKRRLAWWVAPMFWLTGHAIFHVLEVVAGVVGPFSLLEDFAGVTLPALITIALVIYAYRSGRIVSSQSA